MIDSAPERETMTWLTKAGIRLSTAELVYLIEHQIHPAEYLLYDDNRQALVECIYTAENIADNILETLMERAQNRDFVVKTLLELLRKKRLVVV